MPNLDFKEKRSYRRHSVEAPITFTMDHNDDKPCNGTSQNLSANGIYITTDHAPKLDTEIRIVLNANGQHTPPIIIEGRVVRCKFDKKDPNLFHVSIEFAKIHEASIQIMTTI
mgnify:CR=1 FL=1